MIIIALNNRQSLWWSFISPYNVPIQLLLIMEYPESSSVIEEGGRERGRTEPQIRRYFVLHVERPHLVLQSTDTYTHCEQRVQSSGREMHTIYTCTAAWLFTVAERAVRLCIKIILRLVSSCRRSHTRSSPWLHLPCRTATTSYQPTLSVRVHSC